MSKDKTDTGDKPVKAKGKGMLMLIIVAIVMMGIGGGGAYALVKSEVIGADKKKEDHSPKLIRKGEDDPYAPKADAAKDGPPDVDGDGGSPYRTSYYNFSDEFTSNLRGSTSLIQVSLACSTQRDGRVLMWLKKHELAVRSAMLAVLADTPEGDVNTIDGKEKLQKRLAAAINKVLVEKEGFGGVDNVYFKSFLVQ